MWRADVATFLVAVDARRGVKVGLTVAQVVMLAAGRVRVTDRAARHQLAALLPPGMFHLAAAAPQASARYCCRRGSCTWQWCGRRR